MRMWMVHPETMCRKHLLGEHVELHMFVGAINKGTSMEGFLANNLLEVSSLHRRHSALVDEMNCRGYIHKSPLAATARTLPYDSYKVEIDQRAALAELHRRCPECLASFRAKISSK